MDLQTLYLVRHAETALNGRYCGSMDVTLSDHGIVQTHKLSDFFRSQPIEICLSSDLKRTQMTAEAICSGKSAPILWTPQIREISFGEWEGKTFAEAKQLYPEIYDQWIANPLESSIPNGEPFPQFAKRIQDFADELLHRKEKNILIVSHGGVISVLLITLLGYGLKQFWEWAPPLASISKLKRDLSLENSPFETVKLKDVSHLQ